MKLLFRKDLATLRPVDESAQQAMEALPRGGVILLTIDQGRNPQHHRKFFALLNLAFKNQEVYSSVELMRHVMLCDIGYGEYITKDNGNVVGYAKSLAYAEMGQVEFTDLYDKSLAWLSGLVKTDIETLRRESA